jgi:hypothetical protein
MYEPMWRNLGLDLLAGSLLVAVWYFIGVRLNRRRSMTILSWIDEAIHGTARIAGLEWLTPSQFMVRLRFPENSFKRAILHVRLHPWELPLRWLMSRMHQVQETMTFEADLAAPPNFNMHVNGQRWTGKARKPPAKLENYQFERLGPFVVTTKRDWEPSVVNAMDTLSSTTPCNFLQVTYNPETPHFTATLALDSLRPGSEYRTTIFDTMRELAIVANQSLS